MQDPTEGAIARAHQLRELFVQASALPPDAQEPFVRQTAADSDLQDELLALLAAQGTDSTRAIREMAQPALAQTAGVPMPTHIGPYRILDHLGSGGNGAVYRAERSDLKSRVAIKVPQVAPGPQATEVLARFDLERRALAAMNHSGIAKVFDAGTTEEGRPFFVMELVDGEPLTTFCDRRRLSVADRLRLFQQACEAVHHAHVKGVVHRDLKPDNVLVVDEGGSGVAKVLDFGIAKALDPSQFAALCGVTGPVSHLGTWVYMSPEQVEGRSIAVDARSDIYTLGVMLFELLTGELPFPKDRLERIRAQEGLARMVDVLSSEEPDQPSRRISKHESHGTIAEQRGLSTTGLRRVLTGDLDWIVLKAMAKEPERRYAAATALAEDLQRHIEHQPVSAGPPTARYRAKKFLRRNRHWLIPAAMGLVGLGVFAVAQWRNTQRDLANRAYASGLVAFQTGRFPEAMSSFDLALANGHEQTIRILCDQVECLEAQELVAEARDKLLAIPVGTTPADEARRRMLVGAIGVDRVKDPSSGMDELRAALAIHDTAISRGEVGLAAGDLAYLRCMLAEDVDDMVAALREGIAAEPFHRLANAQLPAVLLFAGDHVGSLDASRTLLARWPDDPSAATWLQLVLGLSTTPPPSASGEPALPTQEQNELAILTREITSWLRQEFEEGIEDTARQLLRLPKTERSTPETVKRTLKLLGALAAFRGPSAAIGDLAAAWRRVPSGILRMWQPAIAALPTISTEFHKNPKKVLAVLDAMGTSNPDAVAMLLRAVVRLKATDDYDGVFADLQLAARHRGPLGAMPELARLLDELRAATLMQLRFQHKEDPARQATLVSELMDFLRPIALRSAPTRTAVEWTLFAQMAATRQEHALARDLLLRAHQEHPDDTDIMVRLGQSMLALKDPLAARRWLLQALAIEPDNKVAEQHLQKANPPAEASHTK